MDSKEIQQKPDSLIRLPEVMSRTGKKKTAIYEGMKDGNFPKAIKDGNNTLWSSNEIDAYVEAMKASRFKSANDDQEEQAA